ncbi:MAG: hypothetical protein WD072_10165 [Pirellulales bacterium]
MLNRPTTAYFQHVRRRPDRVIIYDEGILQVIDAPEREEVQPDGPIRRWKRISEAGRRALRVILLADKMTIHNAFFDRDFGDPDDEGQVF